MTSDGIILVIVMSLAEEEAGTPLLVYVGHRRGGAPEMTGAGRQHHSEKGAGSAGEDVRAAPAPPVADLLAGRADEEVAVPVTVYIGHPRHGPPEVPLALGVGRDEAEE